MLLWWLSLRSVSCCGCCRCAYGLLWVGAAPTEAEAPAQAKRTVSLRIPYAVANPHQLSGLRLPAGQPGADPAIS